MSYPIAYSASAEAAFRDCQRKWFWAHYRGFRPTVKPDALQTGIAWHELLEGYWRGSREIPASTILADEPQTDREAKLQAMMVGYLDAYPLTQRPKVLAIEKRFEMPLLDT